MARTGIRAAYAAGAAAVVTKTIGLQAAVNPTPHIWLGQRSSLLNTEKWSDLPPEQWLERELPALRDREGLLIASVGNSPADVAELAGPLARAGADLLEVVSYAAADTAPMVELAVGRAGIPVLAKVSANWPDLLDVVDRCVKAGAAGITAIDSVGPVLQINVETGRPLVSGPHGHAWLSGAAIKPLAVRAVADIKLRHEIPVVAVGGVMNARDVVEMLMVGATAVGVHTSPLLQGLGWFARARNELDGFLAAHGWAYAGWREGKLAAVPRCRTSRAAGWPSPTTRRSARSACYASACARTGRGNCPPSDGAGPGTMPVVRTCVCRCAPAGP